MGLADLVLLSWLRGHILCILDARFYTFTVFKHILTTFYAVTFHVLYWQVNHTVQVSSTVIEIYGLFSTDVSMYILYKVCLTNAMRNLI